ncbi:MAG: hypothetical protein SVM80_05230 [Halobacteriota archaeon]|nr:hypothetical protein [Halobacteriota archaeon]
MVNRRLSFSSYVLALGSFILLTLLLLAGFSAAEAPLEEWNRTFGGEEDDAAYSIQQTTDGGYILAGETGSYDAEWYDAWLIKIDSKGVEEWNRAFGDQDVTEVAYSVQQTKDGGYIVVSSSITSESLEDDMFPQYDAWLIKTDSKGVEEWNRTYGDQDVEETVRSVQQTTDGGYILAGYTDDDYGPFIFDAWLIKTDSKGVEEWNKAFDGEDFDIVYSIQQTSDGGYVFTASKPIGEYCDGHRDALLVKIEGEEGASETSTPGFEVFTAISSATIITVILILRRRRV